MKNTLCLAGLALAALAGCGTQIKTAGGHYHDYCAACHGDDMTGGTGSSLVDAQWNHGATDEAIARVIRDGLPQMEMPAFGAASYISSATASGDPQTAPGKTGWAPPSRRKR
jgi:mono/diheme cytochrome c family protein